MGFYSSGLLGDHEGFIKIQVSDYPPEQIDVTCEWAAYSEAANRFFEQLMKELDRLGQLWLKADSEPINNKTSENDDYQPEEVIKLIQQGGFDGCGIERKTAIATVEAIVWLMENSVEKLTAQAIAKEAGYQREHYYNFRKGCIKAGIKKIKGIDVISVRKNN
jgi:hypothetical protein